MVNQTLRQEKTHMTSGNNPRLELVCVGSELLNFKINTHGVYISRRLAEIGLKLNRETTVGDDLPEIVQALADAYQRSDIVITTGGLGPTFDDLTREAWAQVLNLPLIKDEKIAQWLAGFFKKRHLHMPEENLRQAEILKGAKVLPNTAGTAPGQLHESDSQTAILLPGPLSELSGMMDKFVLPYLQRKFKHGASQTVTLHIAGKPETHIDERIRPVVKQAEKTNGQISLCILAHQFRVDIQVIARGANVSGSRKAINLYRDKLLKILGNDVYGENGVTLEEVAGKLLLKRNATLALAESCTGGLIAGRITGIPGSSKYFLEGTVVYSNESKTQLLGVNPDIIKRYGAVSAETARHMALGAQKRSRADYALAVTGIAGPGGGTKQKPVGLVYITLATPDKTIICRKYLLSGQRDHIRELATMTSLDLLRRHLLRGWQEIT